MFHPGPIRVPFAMLGSDLWYGSDRRPSSKIGTGVPRP